jgi:cytochrome c oxidase assembly protein subunit 15
MFLYPLSWWVSGPWDLFIEHGHRLLGSLVGILTIALSIVIWRSDPRPWMRWLGVAALLLVVAQGVLGGMRVTMASTDLARAHGCTGPLFYALTIVLCVATSQFWYDDVKRPGDKKDHRLSRGAVVSAWAMFGMAYLQLVAGAYLRHPGIQWSPGTFRAIVLVHVVLAVLILIKAIAIAGKARLQPSKLKSSAMMLLIFVGCQLVMGVAAWRANYGWPSFLPFIAETQADRPAEIAFHNALAGGTVAAESMTQALTVTGHVALGSLILAASVCYATRLSRAYFLTNRPQEVNVPQPAETSVQSALSSTRLEGAIS